MSTHLDPTRVPGLDARVGLGADGPAGDRPRAPRRAVVGLFVGLLAAVLTWPFAPRPPDLGETATGDAALAEQVRGLLAGEHDAAYSNLGFALLGEALAAETQASYPQMLQARLLDPLGLDDTTQRGPLLSGHRRHAVCDRGARRARSRDTAESVDAWGCPPAAGLGRRGRPPTLRAGC